MSQRSIRICLAIMLTAHNVCIPQAFYLDPEHRFLVPKIDTILANPAIKAGDKFIQILQQVDIAGFNQKQREAWSSALALLAKNVDFKRPINADGSSLFHALTLSKSAYKTIRQNPYEDQSVFTKIKDAIGQKEFSKLLAMPNKKGQTPFLFAVEAADYYGMSELINHAKEYNKGEYPTNNSAMVSAALINKQTNAGKTPLYRAAEIGNQEAAQALLKSANPDVRLRDKIKGITAYDVALENGNQKIADLIRDFSQQKNISNFSSTSFDSRNSSQPSTSSSKNMQHVIDLIMQDTNLSSHDKFAAIVHIDISKQFPGQLTAERIWVDTVKKLCGNLRLDDPIKQNGMLVLHVLLSSPNLKIPSILSKLLGSLQSQTRWPKILAATDNNGQTSLHIAAAYNANLLQWLFSNPDTIKAILNQQTHDGKTALMKAAEEGNLKSVDLLLSNSADITVQDRSGYTAYDLAARNGYTDVTNLISEYAKAKNISNFANTYKN